jgi:hypothetical protein
MIPRQKQHDLLIELDQFWQSLLPMPRKGLHLNAYPSIIPHQQPPATEVMRIMVSRFALPFKAHGQLILVMQLIRIFLKGDCFGTEGTIVDENQVVVYVKEHELE